MGVLDFIHVGHLLRFYVTKSYGALAKEELRQHKVVKVLAHMIVSLNEKELAIPPISLVHNWM